MECVWNPYVEKISQLDALTGALRPAPYFSGKLITTEAALRSASP